MSWFEYENVKHASLGISSPPGSDSVPSSKITTWEWMHIFLKMKRVNKDINELIWI